VSIKIKPTDDHVIIKRETPAEVVNGIHIPSQAQNKPQEGIVVAIGPGAPLKSGGRRPVDLKVNDRVLFGRYSGCEMEVEGDTLLIMHESDVIGSFERE
jgi:chaperonin GroES